MKFFSRHGQDHFLLERFFRGKRGRRSVEVGGSGDADQAEFRKPPYDEIEILNDVDVARI